MPASQSTTDAHATTQRRLHEVGLSLPPVSRPVASYVPAARTGNLIYTSGQLPLVAGALNHVGKVGAGVSVEEAVTAARVCALNALAAIAELADLDAIVRVVKVVGFVASERGFNQQPQVINGASDLLVHAFGDAGKHARSAVGVAELPLDAPVEIELIVDVRG